MKKYGQVMGGLLFLMMTALTAQASNPYPAVGTCDGLPKVNVKTTTGTCLGVVAHDLKMPRGILPLSDNELWVTEMGSWERNSGRLSRLVWQNGQYHRTTLLDKLDRPHGIQLGKDGWVYIAEAGRIIRLNPTQINAGDQPNAHVVVDHLPDDGHHPLKQILLDDAGNIFVSMGAKTNICEGKNGQNPAYPCAESTGAKATASIWKITSLLNQPKTTIYARGLRNAMGMTWSAKNELIVTENSRDFINQSNKKLNDTLLPHDELNVVKMGGDYGWPYCYDTNRLSPEYAAYPKACAKKSTPTALLPAHSAPLGMIVYPDDGSIAALRGRYLIALHGYRDTGHRLVAVGADSAGRPVGKYTEVIGHWDRTEKQPMGAPVEVRAAPSGKLYITDDRNDAVLRLQKMD